MTNDELKKKIVEVIDNWADNAVKTKRSGASVYDPYNAAELADALITAGLRFGENLTATFDHMALEREHELERRLAEAEKEIEEYKRKIEYGKLVEPVWFISFMNDLPCYGRVIGYQEDSGFVMQCSDCMISAKKIYLSEEEAEAELKAENGE